jgi:hypothetical protein
MKSNESDNPRSNPEGGKLTSGEPDAVKVCAAERGVESSTESREIGGIFLSHPIHLKAKARGEKSMSEKQRTWEGV